MHTRRITAGGLSAALSLLLLAGCSDEPDPTAQDYVDAATAAMLADGEDTGVEDEEDARCLAEGVVEAVTLERLVREDVSPREFAELDALVDLPFLLPEDAPERIETTIQECIDLDATLQEQVGSGMPIGDASCLTDAMDHDVVAGMLADALIHADEDRAAERFGASLLQGAPPDCIERLILDGLVGDGSLTPEQAACVAPALDDALAHRVFVTAAGGGTPSPEDQAAFEGALRGCLGG
ncbi:hypothetical protein [Actinomarinicola tropica]|uniref:Uncharacterized protein n=1 Tax=Actinomarinicola tropica TaxID=2789776 RepID=A0A5Q2RR04_9ACTN|nr:hypothetical protein [Actinomarinicola tropica]QGG96866.1 hypothetical protein GH723_18160 [Actinomarinicola tropica]